MPNLLDAIRETFVSRLQGQTNWGKNQVVALYNEVCLEVLSNKTSNAELLEENGITTKQVLEALDASFKKSKEKQVKGVYTPRGSAAYDSMETPIPNEDNPFHDDEDINKSDR